MAVTTPTATMGIRGTTVSVNIATDNGVTQVQVALNRDPDGSLGRIEIFDLNGNQLGVIETTDTSWIVTPTAGESGPVARVIDPGSPEAELLQEAVAAFEQSTARAESGGALVEGADGEG